MMSLRFSHLPTALPTVARPDRSGLPWLLAASLLVSSCARIPFRKPTYTPQEPSPFGATGIPPHLRAASAEDGTSVAPGGNSLTAPPLQITPDEDILFTDPDNPEAGVAELDSLMVAPSKGPWEQSESVARKRSAREGKPLLIWFTDSQTSPMCKLLSEELFARHEFGDWANEHLIRLKVDSNTRVKDDNLSMDKADDLTLRIKDYVERLKKQYKVLGHPTLILLNPNGGVIGRYRGYKRGEADYLWGQMKQGAVASDSSYRSWKEALEKKGYRDWTDLKGRTFFAKLLRYQDGELLLVEPDGSRARTRESKLSKADQNWIEEQKKLRGLP